MLNLFIDKPSWSDAGNDELAGRREILLNELESVLWSIISSGARSELRLWLCSTIAGMTSISPQRHCEAFISLLRSKPYKKHIAAQLLQMLFEKQPHKMGRVLAKKSFLLKNFFRGNSRHIMEWFSNFSIADGLEHRKGAKALSQFAFVNRDICWEELEWKGKHGQSPAMVATKPHYFLDLNVEFTVKNFLEYVPEFWSSNEFADSLKDGEILFLDTRFFVNLFCDLMYKEDLNEIWDVIEEFLEKESFSYLCSHLLIILEEQDLLVFLRSVSRFLQPSLKNPGASNSSQWFEIILGCSDFSSINQLILLNAVTNQVRQLMRLVHEEGSQEEREKVKNITFQICSFSAETSSFTPMVKDCIKRKTLACIKWLGLQSWAFYYRLSEEMWTSETWEALFVKNGISFQKSDKSALLCVNEGFVESGSDSDERSSIRNKSKKKSKRRKKRQKICDRDEDYNHELLELELPNSQVDLKLKAGGWLLSTDGYSSAWSSVDLPEHISRYCFFTWMKWVFL